MTEQKTTYVISHKTPTCTDCDDIHQITRIAKLIQQADTIELPSGCIMYLVDGEKIEAFNK